MLRFPFAHGQGALVLLALAAGVRPASAQCPDGTIRANCNDRRPPPPPPLDSNRIAILPFRTAGLDPALAHLGIGLMELLSAEFNGETGPGAVESGESHRAWERTGGDRTPLTQAQAVRVARELGAGQLLLGSIVGTAAKFTVTATILNVPDAAVRVARIHVEGTEADLAALSMALASQLLGKAIGVSGTSSSEALWAYISGMRAYRKSAANCGTQCEAEAQFLRAIKLDSAFIHPAYRLVLLRALFGPTRGIQDFRAAFQNLWRERRRLNPEQRVLFEAVADSSGMVFRMQALPRLERAIASLPNSAEAWDILGDLYYHVGALIGREDWAEQSRRAFLRAERLNATLCICTFEHLADIAWLEGDARTFAKYSSTPWQRYQAAILKGQSAGIRAARTEYVRELATNPEGVGLERGGLPFWLTGIPLPMKEIDSVLTQLEALATSERQRRNLTLWTSLAANLAGRPGHATETARRFHGADSTRLYTDLLLYAYDDSVAAERLFPLLDKTAPVYNAMTCEVALSRLRRADTTGVATILAALGPADRGASEIAAAAGAGPVGRARVCGHVLRGVLASLEPSGVSLLFRADSLMRQMPLNFGDIWNYDLGLALARRGEYAMAASAVRRHWRGTGGGIPRHGLALRLEGRWAALAGDTASSIKAYRQYLSYRDNPEPALVPQRDSVRAELKALDLKARRN